jgi:phosphate transport system protein
MGNNLLNAELHELQQLLLRAASLVEQNAARAVQALLERNEELAKAVEAADAAIDEMEKTIDQAVMAVLYRQRPVAHDLRQAFTTAKISTDLERVGDAAVSIARAVRKMTVLPNLDLKTDLARIGQSSVAMLREAATAIPAPDVAQLEALIARDKELDRMHRELIEEVTRLATADGARAAAAIQMVIVARNLERIGDHATNIAEELIFLAQAVDIRHTHGEANQPA